MTLTMDSNICAFWYQWRLQARPEGAGLAAAAANFKWSWLFLSWCLPHEKWRCITQRESPYLVLNQPWGGLRKTPGLRSSPYLAPTEGRKPQAPLMIRLWRWGQAQWHHLQSHRIEQDQPVQGGWWGQSSHPQREFFHFQPLHQLRDGSAGPATRKGICVDPQGRSLMKKQEHWMNLKAITQVNHHTAVGQLVSFSKDLGKPKDGGPCHTNPMLTPCFSTGGDGHFIPLNTKQKMWMPLCFKSGWQLNTLSWSLSNWSSSCTFFFHLLALHVSF